MNTPILCLTLHNSVISASSSAKFSERDEIQDSLYNKKRVFGKCFASEHTILRSSNKSGWGVLLISGSEMLDVGLPYMAEREEESNIFRIARDCYRALRVL